MELEVLVAGPRVEALGETQSCDANSRVLNYLNVRLGSLERAPTITSQAYRFSMSDLVPLTM